MMSKGTLVSACAKDGSWVGSPARLTDTLLPQSCRPRRRHLALGHWGRAFEEVALPPLQESRDWAQLGQGDSSAAAWAPREWPALGQLGHRAAVL